MPGGIAITNNLAPALAGLSGYPEKEEYMDRMFNEKEAAQAMGCSVALMRKMRLYGTGPSFYKLGRLVRYAPADLLAFIGSCRKEVK
jgi:hypothetical protein